MVRVNMTAVNFYDKVCEKITDDEVIGEDVLDGDYEKTGEEAYTDKVVIEWVKSTRFHCLLAFQG